MLSFSWRRWLRQQQVNPQARRRTRHLRLEELEERVTPVIQFAGTNFVNLEAGEIHYVVVPFLANADSHSAAATRAFTEAALNPNGRGWF